MGREGETPAQIFWHIGVQKKWYKLSKLGGGGGGGGQGNLEKIQKNSYFFSSGNRSLGLLQKLVPQLQRYRYKQYQRQPLQPSLCQQHALHLTYGPTLVQSSRRLFSISHFCFAISPYSPKHNSDFSPYMTKQNIFSLICQNKTVRLSGVLAGFDLSFVFLSFWSCPSCLCSHKTIKHLVADQYIYCQFLFCIQFCNYNSLHLLLSSLID